MFLPIPTKGQRSGVVFSGLPMAGAGLLSWNVGPETKALGFSMQSISRLYGPAGRMTNW
jgi:hypothetical protein